MQKYKKKQKSEKLKFNVTFKKKLLHLENIADLSMHHMWNMYVLYCNELSIFTSLSKTSNFKEL